MTIAEERAAVVAEAMSWRGTGFHHGARLKGVGVDCAQLVIAVFSACGLVEAPAIEFYAPDWFLHEDRDRVLEALRPHCVPVDWVAPGNIALFRYGRAVSHCAIVVEALPEPMVVHSFRGVGVTLESIARGTPLRDRLASFWTLTRWTEGA